MSDIEIKDPDLIDRREFRKRQKIYFEKHREHQQEFFKIVRDNTFTVGRIIEESELKFSAIQMIFNKVNIIKLNVI